MKHLYSRRWMLALFILFPLLAMSVYRTGAVEATPSATPTADVESTDEGTPVNIQMVFGPGSFTLSAPTVGLATLASYRATLTLSFMGTKNGQLVQWTRTYVMLASQKPAARQMTIDRAGSDAAQVFMAELNGVRYERKGGDACIATVIEKGGSLAERWEPASFLTSVIGAEEAGSGTVNGVAAHHYTFDERSIGQQGITQSKGELWIATVGGYIVKYTLATTGRAAYFSEGTQGTISWDYALTDVNQPVAVTLPVDCPPGLVDVPLMPDAANVLRQLGLLSYSTTASVADAAAFYLKQLPTLGWQLHTDASITKDQAELDFTNGIQGVWVVIAATNGKTTVQVILGPVPEGTNVPTMMPTRTLRPTRTLVPTRTPAPTRTKVPTRTPKP